MLQRNLLLMLTFSLSSLIACQPASVIPTENRSSARPSPPLSSQPLPLTPSPQPSVTVPDTPVQTPVPLTEGARLELSLPIRFFDTPGQQTQIRVRLLDARGQEIPLHGRKWLFGNSRPQDFSLSETGLLTALSDSGFSEISVQLAGTDLRATHTVSVNGVTTFVSGGGAAPTPSASPSPKPSPTPLPSEQVTATFQFEGLARGEFPVNREWGTPTVAVASDADGDTVISWSIYAPTGNDKGIYAQRYTPTGLPRGEKFQVSHTTSDRRPGLAMDAEGNFVVVWQAEQNGDPNIYAQRYTSAGLPIGSEFTVNTYTTSEQGAPDVAMNSQGDFVVSWQSYGQDGDGLGIYAQRYSSTGSAEGSEFQVNTYTSGTQESPAVALNSAGDFVISWQSQGQDGDEYYYYNVYAQRYSSTGLPQGSEFRVNPQIAGDQVFSDVGIDSSGNFVAAWKNSDQNGQGVFAQRYLSNGDPAGSEFQVNNVNVVYPLQTQLAMGSEGNFAISWVGVTPGSYAFNIYARRFDSTGQAQGSEFQVNRLSKDQESQQTLATNSLGHLIIVWSHGGDPNGENIAYAKRYSAEGLAQ